MNGACGLVAIGDGLDEDARSKGDIAACKHAGGCSHEVLIDLEDPARRDRDAFFATKERKVSLLTNGQDHAFTRNDFLFVTEGGTEAAILIEDAEAAADTKARDDAVFSDNFFGAPTVVDHDAFMFGLIHFSLPCRHLRARFETY